MNLPNKLTLLRVIFVPFFVFFLLTDVWGAAGDFLALILFIAASLTDLLDGKIARKYHLVTNFGKFMDPLADKLLVSSAMICLMELDRLEAWIVIVIIAREFIISGFRLIAADNRVVIAASMWGKSKTVLQMAMIIILLLNLNVHIPITAPSGSQTDFLYLLGEIVTYFAVALTAVSLTDYLIKNRNIMKEQK